MFQDIIMKKTKVFNSQQYNLYDPGFRDDLFFAFAIQKKQSVQLQVDDFKKMKIIIRSRICTDRERS